MDRDHLLAAELFSYSFANYSNHLGIGHERFEKLMPQDAKLLERAETDGWTDARIAEELQVEVETVPEWRLKLQQAKAVVDAPTPADSFRVSVRFAILTALEDGLVTPQDVDALTKQICYRVSDLSVLLDLKDESLSEYSQALRKE